ncbi:TOM complex subunit Tom70 [Schizosaccharomyces japonicus yFS275]|uniref:TOM complex subunit Tom70 n=1 Tax=Schizosaccharomyces japonicus (strain yFS275 / FY16936) TaxID=402676 RepID=B6K8B9_SCHJY|nr:TOM complex subunit Tom70 [Schizosaccharomyces japonicus yFS275]EEB09773.1 TOM complex subunit Tom70 [Schizosaccharomyces japonicus yFS275]
MPEPAIVSVSVPAENHGLWSSFTSFVERHKKLVYTTGILAVCAGVGGVYYVHTQKQKSKKSKKYRKIPSDEKLKKMPQSEENVDTAEKQTSSVTETKQEPVSQSEAVDAKTDLAAAGAAEAAASLKKKKNKKKKSKKKVDDEKIALTAQKLKEMSQEEREKLATELKTEGNLAYGRKDYVKAIELYTQAIIYNRDPIYFSNRAACFAAIGDYNKVVSDTSEALSMNPTYVKALNRRAAAYEQLDRLDEALMDCTVSCIFDGFTNEALTASVERLLKKVAERKAEALMKTRERKLPSATFIRTYLDSFRAQPALEYENGNEGDAALAASIEALEQGKFAESQELVNKACATGCSSDKLSARAYNLVGTYKFVSGDSKESIADFEKAIELDPTFIQPYVRLGAAYLDENERDKMWKTFEKAESVSTTDPDLYYHRAQVHFISGDFAKAIKDYRKSNELDDTFIYGYIQLAVAQYKSNEVEEAVKTFEMCKERFPDSGEVYNYYGEILLDQQKFDEALDHFDRAIELGKKKSAQNVMNAMPLINKALTVFQAKRDVDQAEKLCQQALDADPECDIAVASMAQFLLQQGKPVEALKYFEKSADLARTESEMVNAFSYSEATRTQIALTDRYPELVGRLNPVV